MKCLVVLLALLALVQASDVLKLTTATFDQVISDHPLIAVEFFAPWCGHCKALAPEWEQAASDLAGQVPLASVDCTAEQSVCQKFEVQGYPTLKLFRNSVPSPLEVNRKAVDIVNYLNAELLPVPKPLTTQEEIDAFATEHSVVVVTYFASKEDPHYNDISALAEELRHIVPVGAVVDSQWGLGGKQFPLITIHRKFGREKLEYEGEIDLSQISFWIARAKVALLGEIHGGNYMDYMNTGLPVGYLFVDGKEDNSELFSKLEPTAEKLKNQIAIAWIDNNKYTQQAKRLGLSGEELPAFVIDDQHTGLKYVYPETQELFDDEEEEEEEEEEGDLASWLAQWAAGGVEPFIKSEPIPEQNDGPVKILVRHNFDSIVKDPTKDVLVEFYAPWCGHCKQLAPIYEQLGEHFRDSNKVVIAKIDATANDVDPAYGITGFPTIIFFPAENKDHPIPYEGNRSLDDLIAFVSDEEDEEEEEFDHDEL